MCVQGGKERVWGDWIQWKSDTYSRIKEQSWRHARGRGIIKMGKKSSNPIMTSLNPITPTHLNSSTSLYFCFLRHWISKFAVVQGDPTRSRFDFWMPFSQCFYLSKLNLSPNFLSFCTHFLMSKNSYLNVLNFNFFLFCSFYTRNINFTLT